MTTQSDPKRPPPPRPIPDVGVPETRNEPFPLVAKLIKLIKRK